MKVYLDASVLVALLTNDASTSRAEAFFRQDLVTPVVSDFAAAEFASAVARRVRTGEIDTEMARKDLATLDAWIARVSEFVAMTSADLAEATIMLRRLDLTLRTPDAIHLALCRRISAGIATFDEKMKVCAATLGIALAPA